ncbi:type II toxin-antitoxin system HicA family toxin [Alkalispirochaeta americana]|uniref:type II toxin-antitoxin system HicA family toxin n=1 Tax=Alkalispirochaeta americana TaxID=159291 RepID=UPI00190EDF03
MCRNRRNRITSPKSTPEQEQLDAKEAEHWLPRAGFELVRTKGSHRIYRRDDDRITIPFH